MEEFFERRLLNFFALQKIERGLFVLFYVKSTRKISEKTGPGSQRNRKPKIGEGKGIRETTRVKKVRLRLLTEG